MSDKLPRDPGRWLRNLIRVVLAIAIAVILAGLLFPTLSDRPTDGRIYSARNDAFGITVALKAYYTEYGHWPDFTGDGLFLDEQRHGQLMRVLCAKDEVNNPRKIVFIEGRDATESSGKYRNGIRRKTGVLYDPWGQPYRVAIETSGAGTIANPYPDDGPIHAIVIVWSLGKDGQQGAPANPHTHKGSDDVTSWQ